MRTGVLDSAMKCEDKGQGDGGRPLPPMTNREALEMEWGCKLHTPGWDLFIACLISPRGLSHLRLQMS
jgi:hypothetical protein